MRHGVREFTVAGAAHSLRRTGSANVKVVPVRRQPKWEIECIFDTNAIAPYDFKGSDTCYDRVRFGERYIDLDYGTLWIAVHLKGIGGERLLCSGQLGWQRYRDGATRGATAAAAC